jgi:amidase
MDRLKPTLNAIVTTDIDRAYERAAQTDEAGANGAWSGPLHGLPFTVKDAIETGGIRSTGGASQLATHVPISDAALFGKTNAPTWSANIQAHNDLFGTTNNPWDLGRSPGGSSGGAAAAVASGLTAFELGTDIGGSVRIPASFCGIFGHKPSFGLVPQPCYLDHVGGGTIDADINVFGPLARSVEDLELLLGVLAGPGDDDAVAWSLELPAPRSSVLADLRIGTWLTDPLDGATSELSAIGHRQWLELTIERAAVRAVWSDWFSRHDVLLAPVMPMPPIVHDTKRPFMERTTLINGELRPHLDCTAWTGLVGMAYLPSTVIPVGRTRSGLPVGMQVIGPFLEDRTSLTAGRLLFAVLGEWPPPPLAAVA